VSEKKLASKRERELIFTSESDVTSKREKKLTSKRAEL
jgi:hypothetical protein